MAEARVEVGMEEEREEAVMVAVMVVAAMEEAKEVVG